MSDAKGNDYVIVYCPGCALEYSANKHGRPFKCQECGCVIDARKLKGYPKPQTIDGAPMSWWMQ